MPRVSTQQFTMQASYSVVLTAIVVGIIAVGVIFIVLGVLGKFRAIGISILNGKYGGIIGGIILIALALGLFFVYYAPSTITVGSGYVNVQFAGFSPNLPFIPFLSGNKNITTSEIANAFVGEIGSGDFSLDKQSGFNLGNVNVGVFTLGNGATAYVASNNSTDLIIQLNNGQYVILGTSNTNVLAASFSQNVYPLKSP